MQEEKQNRMVSKGEAENDHAGQSTGHQDLGLNSKGRSFQDAAPE